MHGQPVRPSYTAVLDRSIPLRERIAFVEGNPLVVAWLLDMLRVEDDRPATSTVSV